MSTKFIKASIIAMTIILLPGCASTSDFELAREQAAAAQKTANEAKISADAAKTAAEDAKKSADEAKRLANETNSKINQVFRKSMHK